MPRNAAESEVSMENPKNEPEVSDKDEGGTDYKALWEQAKADAEKWKAMSRKNETRAKNNAGAAKDLEEVNQQMAELSQQLADLKGENDALKANAERAKLVSKVAEATGVPEAIVSTLAATDENALTQAATAIADAYKTPGGAPAASEAGTRVSTSETGGDGSDWLREALSNN